MQCSVIREHSSLWKLTGWEEKEENPVCLAQKLRGYFVSAACHLIHQADRSAVLAKCHWQEAPLLLALHYNHKNFVKSTSQDPGPSPAIAGPYYGGSMGCSARNWATWLCGVCTSESSITSASSVSNRSNLSGKYAPDHQPKSPQRNRC